MPYVKKRKKPIYVEKDDKTIHVALDIFGTLIPKSQVEYGSFRLRKSALWNDEIRFQWYINSKTIACINQINSIYPMKLWILPADDMIYTKEQLTKVFEHVGIKANVYGVIPLTDDLYMSVEEKTALEVDWMVTKLPAGADWIYIGNYRISPFVAKGIAKHFYHIKSDALSGWKEKMGIINCIREIKKVRA